MKPPPLERDLNYILCQTASLWNELRDQQIFITGGTGFFGCWILESFLWINKALNLNAKATILTRNIENFAKKRPHLFDQPALTFCEGDICYFEFPAKKFSHIIHGATDTNLSLTKENPFGLFRSITQGTERILEFAQYCDAKKFLFISSGAIYGKQPDTLSQLPESHSSQLDLADAKASYALGKCAAEHLCYLSARQAQFAIKIARCFAFVGPYLPLDEHYAIGNFIADALKGQAIQVNGDGSPFRSYLYAADLAIWLWTILFCGKSSYPYNVGSDEAYSIAEIAHLVANSFDSRLNVRIMQTQKANKTIERYIPNITRARKELNLNPSIKLIEAIKLTREWHSQV